MKITQNKILVENPFYKKGERAIQLSESQQEEMIIRELEKCKELTVFKAGEHCVTVKEGDKVYIDIDRLMKLPRVVLKIEDKERDFFIGREADIDIIY